MSRADQLLGLRNNSEVLVAGVRVATQTPPMRGGKRVVFISIDDGTGCVDATFFTEAQEKSGPLLFGTRMLLIRGLTRRTGPRGITVQALEAWDLQNTALLPGAARVGRRPAKPIPSKRLTATPVCCLDMEPHRTNQGVNVPVDTQITINVEGVATSVATGTTGAELFFERRDVVVMRVDGVLKDLSAVLEADASVEPVAIDSPDGLDVLRHSTAHVMAQAVQQLRPDAKLGIGPYITDGFYFDFDVAEPFTPEDLKTLEKMMLKIVNQNQKFARRVVTEDEARVAMANEPYKLELLGKKNDGDSAEGVNVEVGAGEITIYENVDRKSGEAVWCDLCRGPHLQNTKLISNAFALTRTSAAYWLGNQNNQQLQRIYGTAWPTKEALKAYQERIAEAERRDHRKLGVELDLFSFPDELGSGLPVFHPKGGIIRKEMEDYSRKRHVEAGYDFVYTPHITKGHLYEVSGHLDWYRDGMFPPMHVDAELNEDGTVRKPGQDYFLKPMNCPMHNLIFRSRGRSYRELPLRLFEFGSVYRYEKSGVVHGLTRVRGMTQDDAHIYCTKEQMKDELTETLNFVLSLLKDYGLEDFYLELSTKNPEKFVGDDDVWEEATQHPGRGCRSVRAGTRCRSRWSRVLRPQDLRAGQGRPGPHLADVHHPAGLQPARAF